MLKGGPTWFRSGRQNCSTRIEEGVNVVLADSDRASPCAKSVVRDAALGTQKVDESFRDRQTVSNFRHIQQFHSLSPGRTLPAIARSQDLDRKMLGTDDVQCVKFDGVLRRSRCRGNVLRAGHRLGPVPGGLSPGSIAAILVLLFVRRRNINAQLLRYGSWPLSNQKMPFALPPGRRNECAVLHASLAGRLRLQTGTGRCSRRLRT